MGDRLKSNYENRTRFYLPRRTYVLIRIDGNSFHSYTKDCKRPYDLDLMDDMNNTTIELCSRIQGCQFGYVQSDEISLLITDFKNTQTGAWFDNNLQKIVSISASIATAKFNSLRFNRRISVLYDSEAEVFPEYEDISDLVINKLAFFDSRAWTIPDPTEVYNYFLWRQNDCFRNAISMVAQNNFSSKMLHGKHTDELQEMLFQQKNINCNDLPESFKHGRFIVNNKIFTDVEYVDKRTSEKNIIKNVERNVWQVSTPPILSKDKDWLLNRIPKY